MSRMLVLALVIALAGNAAAYDLGTQAPVKSPVAYPENIPDPARQGGDTIWSALVIPGLPYSDSGTTAGYTDDYDEVCPYDGFHRAGRRVPYTPSSAPGCHHRSVQLRLTTPSSTSTTSVLNLIACNDDFYFAAPCFVYSSMLENVALAAGQTYYIVIDGYGCASADYVNQRRRSCPLRRHLPRRRLVRGRTRRWCPDYVDLWNGGCNTSPSYPFQHIAGALGGSTVPVGSAVFCGVSGWYLNQGVNNRDTDWFTLTVGDGGSDRDHRRCRVRELHLRTHRHLRWRRHRRSAGDRRSLPAGDHDHHGLVRWPQVVLGRPDRLHPAGRDSTYDYVVWFTGLLPEGGR